MVKSNDSSSPGPELIKFELGEGEVVEASSFVPLSMKKEGDVRPRRWTLADLTSTANQGCGTVIGGGSFGERDKEGLSFSSILLLG